MIMLFLTVMFPGLPSSGYFDKPFRLLCKTLDTRTSFVDWASVATNNLARDNILRVFNAVAHLGQWQPTPVKTKCPGRNRPTGGLGGMATLLVRPSVDP